MNLEKTINGFKITTDFKVVDQWHQTPHTGIDLAMPMGTPLEAVMDGFVEMVGKAEKLGNYVRIRLNDGTTVTYGHLKEALVKKGESISGGDVIALSGNTGNSTGPHLHLQASKDGNLIDPEPLLGQVTTVEDDRGWLEILGDIRENGIWEGLTGQDFGPWLLDLSKDLAMTVVNFSDYMILPIMGLLLFAMFGSNKAGKWIYWSIATYIIIKICGVMM